MSGLGGIPYTRWVFGRSTVDIWSRYTLLRKLGQPGVSGQAYVIRRLPSPTPAPGAAPAQPSPVPPNALVVCKEISKYKTRRGRVIDDVEWPHMAAALRREAELVQRLDHPNVVKHYETYEDAQMVYFVLEFCSGGELYDRLAAMRTETEAVRVFRQMVSSVAYLHEQGIAHLDLKPDNFVFADDSETSDIKMIDFGKAQELKERTSRNLRYKYLVNANGTRCFSAPETLRQYGEAYEAADIWSLGVTLFTMLYNHIPFWHPDMEEQRRLVLGGFHARFAVGNGPWFPRDKPQPSEQARDLIARMLDYDHAVT